MDIGKSQELKNKGNQAFKNSNFQLAADFFTQAILFNPDNHILYSNRSGSYVSLDRFEEALSDAQKSIEIKPDYVKGYKRRGLALYKMSRFPQAIQSYKEGLKIDPNNAQIKADLQQAEKKMSSPPPNNNFINQLLGPLLMNPKTQHLLKKPGFLAKLQALAANPMNLMSAMQTDPDIKLVFQAMSQGAPKDFAGAGPGQFQQQIPTQPQAAPKKEESPPAASAPQKKREQAGQALKQKGNSQFKNRNFQKAIQYYQGAIKQNPKQVLFYNNKAAAFIELGRLDLAMTAVNQALLIFDNGECKDFIKKAKVLARKANILAKQECYEEAIELFEKSLLQNRDRRVEQDYRAAQKAKKLKEQKQYINPQIGQKANQEGNQLFKSGKFPDALKRYDEAIKRNPAEAKFYANKGACYVKLMEFARARDEFDKSLNINPNYVRSLTKKGDCHFFLKEYHKALDCYQKGLKLDPQNTGCKEGLQKTKMAMYTTNQKDQQERAKHAMADPQIQAILREPQIQNILRDMQSNPAIASKVLKDPVISGKLNKLIASGIIRLG